MGVYNVMGEIVYGLRVTSGTLRPDQNVRRDGAAQPEIGKICKLRRFGTLVADVQEGLECGAVIGDLKLNVGDMIADSVQ